jgi:hypothetical protein
MLEETSAQRWCSTDAGVSEQHFTSSSSSGASAFIVCSLTTFWAFGLLFAPDAGVSPKPAADRPASENPPPPPLLGAGSLANRPAAAGCVAAAWAGGGDLADLPLCPAAIEASTLGAAFLSGGCAPPSSLSSLPYPAKRSICDLTQASCNAQSFAALCQPVSAVQVSGARGCGTDGKYICASVNEAGHVCKPQCCSSLGNADQNIACRWRSAPALSAC